MDINSRDPETRYMAQLSIFGSDAGSLFSGDPSVRIPARMARFESDAVNDTPTELADRVLPSMVTPLHKILER